MSLRYNEAPLAARTSISTGTSDCAPAPTFVSSHDRGGAPGAVHERDLPDAHVAVGAAEADRARAGDQLRAFASQAGALALRGLAAR